MKRLALLLVLLLASCAPVANVGKVLVERPDGAYASILTDGIGVHPGAVEARGTILIAIGRDIEVLQHPDGAVCMLQDTATIDVLDCRLGHLTGPVVVYMTGEDIRANVTFRRPGSNAIYHVVAE